MSKTPVLLIGGGGHCAAIIDVIECSDAFEVAGIVEADGIKADSVLGYPVLGTDADLPRLVESYPRCILTVGQVGNGHQRAKLYHQLKSLGATFPVILSPSAYVSSRATLGDGTVVMHGAVVNAESRVGANVIINSQALVEHHVEIQDHVHIATGARINGGCRIGEASFIGSGSVLVQGIGIASGTILGAGAVLTRSVEQAGVYFGQPARRQREEL